MARMNQAVSWILAIGLAGGTMAGSYGLIRLSAHGGPAHGDDHAPPHGEGHGSAHGEGHGETHGHEAPESEGQGHGATGAGGQHHAATAAEAHGDGGSDDSDHGASHEGHGEPEENAGHDTKHHAEHPPAGDDHTSKKAAPGSGSHWSYDGEDGPLHWGDLGQGNKVCGAGHQQSPIDLAGALPGRSSTVPEFNYGESRLKWQNNGHTLQADVQGDNYVQLGSKKFDLVQFHFHTPSEHLLGGEQFPMEMHLVHKSKDGELAVLGWFIEEGSDRTFKGIWQDLPQSPGRGEAEMHLDLADFSPAGQTLVAYSGSLTTPPCSEGVNWMVAKTPVAMSGQQIKQFKKLFPMNARPIQELAGRRLENLMPVQLSH